MVLKFRICSQTMVCSARTMSSKQRIQCPVLLQKTEKDNSDSRLAELTKMALIRKGEGEKLTDYTLKLLLCRSKIC